MAKVKKQEYWFVFKEGYLLLLANDSVPTAESLQPFNIQLGKYFNVYEDDSSVIYCDELSEPLDAEGIKWVPLKKALSLIGDVWYVAATKARGILTWNEMHQFCGRCAEKTERVTNKFEKICPKCQHAFYPRISPSMIVLVQKGQQILMARSPHFPEGTYGLIAGFVETGESIEDAVHREVMEEVGIKIKNLRYYGSQAWPFPDSLMIGFYADYSEGELVIDPEEIEAAGWYDLDNLPGYPSTGVSIASRLIRSVLPK